MAQGVTIAIRGDAKGLKSALSEAQGGLESLATAAVAKGQLIAQAVTAALSKMLEASQKLISLANTQIENEARLAAVVKATGNAAGFTAEEMYKQAAALQAITKFGDEAIIEMQAVLATFREVKGQEFIDAQKAALDLSSVLGTDLKGAALQLGKALQDPIKGTMALGRAGVTFTQAQKDQIKTLQESGRMQEAQRLILDELEAQVGGVAEAMAGTFAGKVQQFQNRIGDLGERLGMIAISIAEKFVPAFEAGLTALENWFPQLEAAGQAAAGFVDVILGPMKTALEFMIATGVTAFTIVEFAATKAGALMEIALLSVMLAVVKTGNVIQHVFTEVIPAYAKWLVGNWSNILLDMANATATILENMAANFQMFFEAVQGWLAGEGFDWQWTGLLEGFESTLSALPEIMDRQKGPIEQAMENVLAKSKETAAQDFDKMLQENAAKVQNLFNRPELTPGKDPLKADPKLSQRADDLNKKEDKAAQAQFVALEDLHKRIQASAFGGTPEERAANAAEEQVDLQREQIEQLKNENLALEELVAVNKRVEKLLPNVGGLA